jgi:hypothetical protein
MKTTFLPSTEYKDYLKECRRYAIELGKKQFPIDKIKALIGKENATNFIYASGYVSLDLLKEVLDNCSENKVKTRFNYTKKEGVIKQRVSVEIYSKVVALNYEIRMIGIKIKKKSLWELPEIREAIPDIKERQKFVGRFVNSRCEGSLHYNKYQIIKSCVIKYLSVEWPYLP